MKFVFEVEQAGCESCAERVSAALASLGAVEFVEIDESADMARVVLGRTTEDIDPLGVNQALADASAGGHLYQVRPGSWHES